MSDKLLNWLLRNSRSYPNGLALIETNHVISHKELYQRVSRLAGWLYAQGISEGSRVAVLMTNGVSYVEFIHALMQLKAVLVPLNTRLAVPELKWLLTDVKAKFLISDETHATVAGEISQQGMKHLTQTSLMSSSIQVTYPVYEQFEAAALQAIIYSSGTTGMPKGVRLTLGNHWANAQASYLNLPIGNQDRWLAILPLFHVGGLAIVLRGLFYQMPIIIQTGFDLHKVNQAIDEQGVTVVSVVANMLSRMLEARHNQPYPSHFRYVLIGGGPVPLPLLKDCAALGIQVIQTYGMTETASQAATLAPPEALRKLGSAGKPLAGLEMKIDGTGEILVRGDSVTIGYDNRPDETAYAWRDGWFHTGDIGQMDEEGFLYVLDRRVDLIVTGGENVYPAEVEAVLLTHPDIAEAGVIGRPDERWGQAVTAFVKMKKMVSEVEIVEYCSTRLARYKIPTKVIFVAELPRDGSGKLLRRVLRQSPS